MSEVLGEIGIKYCELTHCKILFDLRSEDSKSP